SILIISALAVAINIVLGTLVSRMQIPLLFLDALGTIFIAALFGPWYGASVGAITNILAPILSGNPKDIPFFIVNAVIGLVVGFIAKKYKFGTKQAIITGVI
ncbi:ECF transporter S component, partial [Vibrio parahaemolyticus]|nr:ECF transporter S component [Vibrio parahaemolyticus]